MVVEFKSKLNRVFQAVILILLSTQVADAQLLWKISKKGQEDSYILGTHHIVPSSMVANITGVDEAYNKSKTVIGEIDIREMQDEKASMKMSMMMLAPEDSLLHDVLGAKSFNQLQDLIDKYPLAGGVDKNMLSFLKPQTVNALIAVAMGMKANETLFPNDNSALGVDLIFEEKALKDKKEIVGLESLDFQSELLYNSESITESGKELQKMLDCYSSNEERALEVSMLTTKLYLAEDLDDLYALATDPELAVCPSLAIKEEAWKNLVDNRNEAWISKLQKEMKKSPSFILVGALHLPGKKGVLELLKQKGYTVTPISK